MVDDLDEADPLAAVFALLEHCSADAGSLLVSGLLVAVILRASQDDEFAALIAEGEAFF